MREIPGPPIDGRETTTRISLYPVDNSRAIQPDGGIVCYLDPEDNSVIFGIKTRFLGEILNIPTLSQVAQMIEDGTEKYRILNFMRRRVYTGSSSPSLDLLHRYIDSFELRNSDTSALLLEEVEKLYNEFAIASLSEGTKTTILNVTSNRNVRSAILKLSSYKYKISLGELRGMASFIGSLTFDGKLTKLGISDSSLFYNAMINFYNRNNDENSNKSEEFISFFNTFALKLFQNGVLTAENVQTIIDQVARLHEEIRQQNFR